MIFSITLQRNLHHPKMSSVQEQKNITWIKFSPEATIPTKGSKYSAGYDLYASQNVLISKRDRLLIPTDIGVKVPFGYYGRIAPRSGFTLKKKTDIGAGVIDADYRGKIGIIIFNHSDVDIMISKGDRIAQIIFEKIFIETERPNVILHSEETGNETERGSGGFGSTGGFN
jgi:dUTP pyrophosphatase